MEIIIHQAILHVLDTTLDAPVLSGGGMELTAEKTAYLQNHIEKLLASDEIRQCRPLPDSAFRNELEHNQDFIDLSCRIAGVLFDYMHAHTTIPGADLAVVDFTRDGAPWLGILKLNYKNGYTHYTETVEGAPVNSIIQQRACLPTQSGKVEEGALVNLTDYSMRLLEKKYDIDGHKEFYLSSVVFQYTQAEPEKKKLQAIQEAAAQAVKDAYEDEPHADAQVAMLIGTKFLPMNMETAFDAHRVHGSIHCHEISFRIDFCLYFMWRSIGNRLHSAVVEARVLLIRMDLREFHVDDLHFLLLFGV